MYKFICPLPIQFFSADWVRIFAWTESALAWNPKNGEVFWIGRNPCSPLLGDNSLKIQEIRQSQKDKVIYMKNLIFYIFIFIFFFISNNILEFCFILKKIWKTGGTDFFPQNNARITKNLKTKNHTCYNSASFCMFCTFLGRFFSGEKVILKVFGFFFIWK